MTEKKIVSLQEYKIRQQRRILPILKISYEENIIATNYIATSTM